MVDLMDERDGRHEKRLRVADAKVTLEHQLAVGTYATLERAQLPVLVHTLRAWGFEVIAPTLHEGAIVYDEIAEVEELPIGWTDEQDAGRYRLRRREDSAVFGFSFGPQSWKQYLHLPRLSLVRLQRDGANFNAAEIEEEIPHRAFLGVRACELHAIGIQDRVFLGGQFIDPAYRARRERIFVVAVNCMHAGGTCFCASMQTGPKATSGFDLALTEVLEDGRHYFVVEVGSPHGAKLLDELPHATAIAEEIAAAERVVAQTAAQMGRTLDTTHIHERLQQRFDAPRWDQVAQRCLTCGNCTMVCPTCFCTSVEDVTDLTGATAERVRRWDSCFTLGNSYVHGGSVRQSSRSRYRQWLTHKFSTWIDQFGTSGCVGCGRCITWCPVGIDVTEEVSAICSEGAVGGDTQTSAAPTTAPEKGMRA